MAATRSARRAASALLNPEDLNKLERLILAQAVYEIGSGSWSGVSRVVSEHPLLSRPKGSFTSESCQSIYLQLMNDAGLVSSDADLVARHGPSNLKLAQRMYEARLLEIRELIAAEETKFKTVVAEIDAIRLGAWDDRIGERLSGKSKLLEESSTEDTEVSQPLLTPDLSIDKQHFYLFNKDVRQTLRASTEVTNTVEIKAVEATESDSTCHQAQNTPLHASYHADGHANPQMDDHDAGQLVEQQDSSRDGFTTLQNQPVIIQDDVCVEGAVVDVVAASPQGPLTAEKLPQLNDEQRRETQKVKMTVDSGQKQETTLADSIDTPGNELKEPLAKEAETVEEIEDDAADVEMKVLTPEGQLGLADSPVESRFSRQDSKRKASDVEHLLSDSEREQKRTREESQPAEEDDSSGSAGPSRRRPLRPPTTEATQVSKKFQSVIIMLHSQISQHRNGNIFHNPIKNSEAPDYREIVKRPMDLKTIKTRIKDGAISNSAEFQRDVYLMFANSMMYNRPKSDIYNMAEEMMLESEAQINSFRQTEGFIRGGHHRP
ncbi:hypothetical protein EW146_g4990 [Bondarzewia mesenterica]|uniref:Bromo domain-containing protein n=1 Tax=Bondarzewia mesenterica TaxID=1095465 RepID=A0A4S4LUM5_9AGAM|nr:hypothetical protein EW146_g4990 [Bondarzewia mesenterica]